MAIISIVNKCKRTRVNNSTINNGFTFGAVASQTGSEGILGTEGFTSSASLSTLTDMTKEKE